MSKKIAEGAQNLVIDLKVGTGAFIKNMTLAEKLAKLLIATGKNLGQKVSVVYTNMNSPLGYYVGNALEIKECIDFLKGNFAPDIYQITKTLAEEMLLLTKLAENQSHAGELFQKVLENGEALDCFRRFVERQNGDPRICDDTGLLPQAKYKIPVISKHTGQIKAINSQAIGYALIDINAGRKTINSTLNYASGAFLPFKIGDHISRGTELGTVFCDDKEIGLSVSKKIAESYLIVPSENKSKHSNIQREKIIFGRQS
jgi:pyrimidine-nucleoside phosphorylase